MVMGLSNGLTPAAVPPLAGCPWMNALAFGRECHSSLQTSPVIQTAYNRGRKIPIPDRTSGKKESRKRTSTENCLRLCREGIRAERATFVKRDGSGQSSLEREIRKILFRIGCLRFVRRRRIEVHGKRIL